MLPPLLLSVRHKYSPPDVPEAFMSNSVARDPPLGTETTGMDSSLQMNGVVPPFRWPPDEWMGRFANNWLKDNVITSTYRLLE